MTTVNTDAIGQAMDIAQVDAVAGEIADPAPAPAAHLQERLTREVRDIAHVSKAALTRARDAIDNSLRAIDVREAETLEIVEQLAADADLAVAQANSILESLCGVQARMIDGAKRKPPITITAPRKRNGT